MSKPNLPILGQPVFRITENEWDEKIQLGSDFRGVNLLTYFAADAVIVKKQEYTDETMTKVVLNKGMVSEKDENVSTEIIIDLKRDKQDHLTIFVDELEAQRVAKQMNINQQKQCKKLVDAINVLYNEYGKVIAICDVR